MSWELIRDRGIAIRPFDGSPPQPAWKRAAFSAPIRSTLATLERELRMLQAERIVLEAAFEGFGCRALSGPDQESCGFDPKTGYCNGRMP